MSASNERGGDNFQALGSGSGTQGGTTGATTNALVKATAANTLGDSAVFEENEFFKFGGKTASYPALIRAIAADPPTLTTYKANETPGCNFDVTGALSVTGTVAITGAAISVNSNSFGAGNGGVYISGSGNDQYFFASGATYASGIDAGLKRADAGVVRVTDGSTGQGAFLSKDVITDKTADYTVTAAESGTIFTNTGAAGTVVFTLPASPVKGLTYEFHITAAQQVDIQTGTAVLIYANAAPTTATTGKLSKNTVGTTIRLTYNGVAWMGPNQSGTWTVS